MNRKMIEVVVRAIILRQEKILLCRAKEKAYYFLPGGHVEFGESVTVALRRELKEELGIVSKKISYITSFENMFRERGILHHEINMIYLVKSATRHIESKEDHIEFMWVELKNLDKTRLLPRELMKILTNDMSSAIMNSNEIKHC